jgi:methionyl-tRNA synthetase
MKKNNFYITTPIYYVNDKPHIGHAYTTLLADVLARYNRLIGLPTWFLTGTDEHGQKVKQAAEKSGISSQEQVDNTVVRFQELWKKLEITNDDFIRTTEPRHKKVVQEFLQDLYDRDEIYRADYDGWYCVACERFYTEKDLVDGNCPEAGCGRKVEQITETNYFFRMSKYQNWLIEHIQENPKFIQPDFRRNETLGFLKKKLNDLCISRPKSRMDWGIELPFDKDFVTYVWFDALLNYISAIGCHANEEEFKKWWPASYHLIGKDILTTHTVYWPTMLKAMNLPMPKTIFAHGWWLIGRDKMSKTAGNVVNPMHFADQYGVDPFRYFLMAEMTLGQDASFTEEAFVRRYNADLANDLGNMLNRVIKIVRSSCEGNVPSPGHAGEDELVLQGHVKKAASDMIQAVENMRIDLGLTSIAKTVREANKYLEKTQPWLLAKNNESERLGTVLYYALESLRVISGLLYPVMPGKMTQLRQCLGLQVSEPVFKDLSVWGKTKPDTKVGEMINLFPRIQKKSSEPIAQNSKANTKADQTSKESNLIDITDFAKVELKVAKVLVAEKIEGADKLLKLQIEIGPEKKQIVAGIAEFYTPEELVGKSVVVVSNLKPAEIRGVESNGMLLAAKKGKKLCLVTPEQDIPTGAKVG